MRPTKLILLGVATAVLLVLPRRSSRSDTISDVPKAHPKSEDPPKNIQKHLLH